MNPAEPPLSGPRFHALTRALTAVYTGLVLRVSDETRDKVLRIGREEFDGASADETIRRLIDEHWRAAAVAAVRLSQETDPQGWEDYLTEAREWESVQAPTAE